MTRYLAVTLIQTSMCIYYVLNMGEKLKCDISSPRDTIIFQQEEGAGFREKPPL